MAQKQAPKRSDSEWFDLITECRKSGLSDTAWCQAKGIPSGTFYCAIQRLREKAYALPERSKVTDNTLDLAVKQDVVQIAIEPDPLQLRRLEPARVTPPTYLDNSHTLEIDVHGINIRVCNDVDRELLKTVLSTLGGLGC